MIILIVVLAFVVIGLAIGLILALRSQSSWHNANLRTQEMWRAANKISELAVPKR